MFRSAPVPPPQVGERSVVASTEIPAQRSPAAPFPPPTSPAVGIQPSPRYTTGARAASVLLATMVVAGGSFLGAWAGTQATPSSTVASEVTVVQALPKPLLTASVDAALTTILPATVTVITAGSSGTGVILSADGEILTNAHVVEGQDQLRVLLHHEVDPRAARLVAFDSESDLAILRIEAEGLPVASFSTTAVLGQEVVAVGYALGLEGEPTVTKGIISATRRTISSGGKVLSNLLQTDAPISSGNSGGPLVNIDGEVVGINTAVYRSSQGTAASNIGFAVRADTALAVAEQLRSGRLPQPALLGISVVDREDGGRGGQVISVDQSGPAAAAGIEEGDIILRVAGIPIGGRASLVGAVRTRPPGDVVDIVISRSSERLAVSVTLAAAPR